MADIYIQDRNEISGRLAIVEDNGKSTWLYLTRTSGEGIESDAFLYSPVEPYSKLNIEDIENGFPPILTRAFASESAVKMNVKESSISFRWSNDGNSVSILLNDEPIAFIFSKNEKGYSKSLLKKGPFGNPMGSWYVHKNI